VSKFFPNTQLAYAKIFQMSKKLSVFMLTALFAIPAYSQVIVQPGAPGKSTRKLPSTTRAVLPPHSKQDTEFMQGMIMHHAQAVEMTALMKERTKNKKLLLLGARISQSQAEEIKFMRRWLTTRGEKTMMAMKMSGEHKNHEMRMPGMLTPKQMAALKDSKGKEFDRLFLSGMIQHHDGALIMVDDLFKNGDAGQDAELFNFATDVDSTQRAEIRIMQGMLVKIS
jgi:uncharacterized protein (DUF305 family)